MSPHTLDSIGDHKLQGVAKKSPKIIRNFNLKVFQLVMFIFKIWWINKTALHKRLAENNLGNRIIHGLGIACESYRWPLGRNLSQRRGVRNVLESYSEQPNELPKELSREPFKERTIHWIVFSELSSANIGRLHGKLEDSHLERYGISEGEDDIANRRYLSPSISHYSLKVR